MKKDKIIFIGTILVGIILILAGFVISPVKVVPIISKYYAHTELNETVKEAYIQKIRLVKIDIIIIGSIASIIAFKLSYLREKLARLVEYIKLQNNRLARITIIMVCIYFLFSSLVTFTPEILSMQYNILYRGRLTDEGKREMVEGKFYEFIKRCRELIPEDAHVLLLDNTKHKHGVTSYYLYPRKLYFNPSDHTAIEDVDSDWIEENSITWYINYAPDNFDLNRAEIGRIK